MNSTPNKKQKGVYTLRESTNKNEGRKAQKGEGRTPFPRIYTHTESYLHPKLLFFE